MSWRLGATWKEPRHDQGNEPPLGARHIRHRAHRYAAGAGGHAVLLARRGGRHIGDFGLGRRDGHYRTACAASEHHHVQNCEPMFAARDKVFGKAHIYPDDARYDDRIKWEQASGFDTAMKRADVLAEAEGYAEIALLEMPAPHLLALRWKLEHTFEPDGEIAEWRESAVAMIRSDVLRLLPL